jgi:hypothetical protein
MTLTEQWKKGELEQGYYYTKYTPKVGKPFIEIELRNYLLDLAKVRDADTVEVLAPVPSYEEWKQLHKFLEEFNALDVAKENQQLKELLKEIRSLWKGTVCMPDSQEQVRDILTKIDNAMGEKSETQL